MLFFLHLESRRSTLAGITRHPTEAWITQMARNAVDETTGALRSSRYLLRDRDAKFCASFDEVLASEGIHVLKLPPRSPNLAHLPNVGCDPSRRNAFPSSSCLVSSHLHEP